MKPIHRPAYSEIPTIRRCICVYNFVTAMAVMALPLPAAISAPIIGMMKGEFRAA
jgi:hypothetical protein